MTAPAIGRATTLLDLLDLPAARLGLTRMSGAQEDRETGDGVADEGRRDPARDDRQPAADKPHPKRQAEQVAIASGGGEPGGQRIDEGLGEIGEGRVGAGQQEQTE